jgi:hypothetical protein
MTLTKTSAKLIDEAVGLIGNGVECWQKAGELIVQLMDEHNMTAADICEQSPYLTENIVRRFEQLGRKQIMPNLLVADYPAARYLVRLPYSEQKRVAAEPVDLLVLDGKAPTTLKVAVENLTPQQCRQVFDGHIRSVGAQRAWLEERRAEQEVAPAIKQAHEFYRVRGRRVVIMQPCELTARQLANIIAEIEG